ncbi:ZF-HD homeobox protein [Hordeum vulgare]|nr:ZF-HD homeobox protein [Hordeum vulgare]
MDVHGFVKKVRQEAMAPAVKGLEYKECVRNHTLSSDGHVVDGCREWMPLGDLNPADASSHKCVHSAVVSIQVLAAGSGILVWGIFQLTKQPMLMYPLVLLVEIERAVSTDQVYLIIHFILS